MNSLMDSRTIKSIRRTNLDFSGVLCPICGEESVRSKAEDTPREIRYCLNCMYGTTSSGLTIDLFDLPSFVRERREYLSNKRQANP